MSPRARRRYRIALSLAVLLGLSGLADCTSIGDFGRLQPDLVTDGIHNWVGRDAARNAGAPVSTDELTEDEHMLRDLAFPLIEPPYDRQRWDALVHEYGVDRLFHREFWVEDPTAYYRNLTAEYDRSPSVRYNKLKDDIRNDIVRIEPFFAVARRVVDIDRRREASMRYIADHSPAERANAEARIGENSLTIAWVQHSLAARCAAYRFALEHLIVAEPEREAADVDSTLTLLQQTIVADNLVPVPRFAGGPRAVVAAQAPPPR